MSKSLFFVLCLAVTWSAQARAQSSLGGDEERLQQELKKAKEEAGQRQSGEKAMKFMFGLQDFMINAGIREEEAKVKSLEAKLKEASAAKVPNSAEIERLKGELDQARTKFENSKKSAGLYQGFRGSVSVIQQLGNASEEQKERERILTLEKKLKEIKDKRRQALDGVLDVQLIDGSWINEVTWSGVVEIGSKKWFQFESKDGTDAGLINPDQIRRITHR